MIELHFAGIIDHTFADDCGHFFVKRSNSLLPNMQEICKNASKQICFLLPSVMNAEAIMDGPSTFIIKYRSFSTTLDLLLWDCCYGILVEMTGGAMRMVCLEKIMEALTKKLTITPFLMER